MRGRANSEKFSEVQKRERFREVSAGESEKKEREKKSFLRSPFLFPSDNLQERRREKSKVKKRKEGRDVRADSAATKREGKDMQQRKKKRKKMKHCSSSS